MLLEIDPQYPAILPPWVMGSMSAGTIEVHDRTRDCHGRGTSKRRPRAKKADDRAVRSVHREPRSFTEP
jgi:hypothetical protein